MAKPAHVGGEVEGWVSARSAGMHLSWKPENGTS